MSDSPCVPPCILPSSTITGSTAPLLFGVLWNWTLYGTLVVQIYVYSYNFPDDRKLLKLLVYSIFFLETLQTALSGADVYYWFASGFSQEIRLDYPFASPFDVPIIGSIVSGTVQLFFAYRVWVLSDRKSWWYCIVIAVCATLGTIGAFGQGVISQNFGVFNYGLPLQIAALIWLVGNTVTDFLIVAAMLYYLTRRRNADLGPWCNHALVKIVRLTIETNIMTTTTSVVALFLVAIAPEEIYYTCPTAILGKLYSNTLLVSLNNRISIRAVSPAGTGTLLTSITRPAKDGPSIVHLETEEPPCASEERKKPGDSESMEDDA
ncbi:hypothetical protein F5888DRAFT_1692625 [Russula emetica]|nr:hypothetical protein F5888DRAFT_1692625 [Russula emetica]